MVSDCYRRIEDAVNEAMTVHGEYVEAIAYKLKKEKAAIERLLALTYISSSLRSHEVDHIVNEFLIHLHEEPRRLREEAEEQMT